MLSLFLLSLGLTAVAEPWDEYNDLSYLRDSGEIEYRLSQLPKSGYSAKKVWSTYHYPYKTGGTEKALLKLERVSPMSRGAAKWEREWVKRHLSDGWGGHCNGMAVAGIVEREPVKPVRFLGVKFSTDDIKALLMEVYQGPMPIVGARCNKKNLKVGRYQRVRRSECRDLNAGTFHLALGNYLGLRNEALIFDVDQNLVVWNWATFKYKIKTFKKISARRAMMWIGEKNPRNGYIYNPDAVTFYRVVTEIKTKQPKKPKRTYHYLLEVDSRGEIVGGEWIGASKKSHPDFVWRPTGYSLENPHIDIATVEILAAKSQRNRSE